MCNNKSTQNKVSECQDNKKKSPLKPIYLWAKEHKEAHDKFLQRQKGMIVGL